MSPQVSAQSDLAASDPIPLSHEYASLQAAPPPANVHEWEVLYGKIGLDLYTELSSEECSALRIRIDQELRANQHQG